MRSPVSDVLVGIAAVLFVMFVARGLVRSARRPRYTLDVLADPAADLGDGRPHAADLDSCDQGAPVPAEPAGTADDASAAVLAVQPTEGAE
jgi:hypothetical protein